MGGEGENCVHLLFMKSTVFDAIRRRVSFMSDDGVAEPNDEPFSFHDEIEYDLIGKRIAIDKGRFLACDSNKVAEVERGALDGDAEDSEAVCNIFRLEPTKADETDNIITVRSPLV